MTVVQIPAEIVACIEAYGTQLKLETAVATRKAHEWFAVLFRHRQQLIAMDFVLNAEGQWEVQNDEIDFDSIGQFLRDKLTKTLF